MALAPKKKDEARGKKSSYVTLNKDGKAVWEPGLRAEITSRRQPRVKRKVDEHDEGPLVTDLKEVLKITPDDRQLWLEKALAAIPKGKVKAQEVFEILTHKKFVAGVPEEDGQMMLKQVKESLMFFSEKQQLSIAKSRLVKDFKSTEAGRRSRRHECDESDEDSSEEDAVPRGRRFSEGDRERERDRPRDAELPPSQASEGAAAARQVEMPPPPPPSSPEDDNLPPEERARREREQAEQERLRAKRREVEVKRIEAERKASERREQQRKAKIGNAFLMTADEEEEVPLVPLLRPPVAEKKILDDRLRIEDDGFSSNRLPTPVALSSASSTDAATVAVTTSAIATMGGDMLVNEAQEILKKGAGVFINTGKDKKGKSRRSRSRKRSRSRRKKSRSRSRSRSRSKSRGRGRHGRSPSPKRRRTYDSLRSPTPDGHLRGQMRAARKAKMMAQMLQQGNVPRVS